MGGGVIVVSCFTVVRTGLEGLEEGREEIRRERGEEEGGEGRGG